MAGSQALYRRLRVHTSFFCGLDTGGRQCCTLGVAAEGESSRGSSAESEAFGGLASPSVDVRASR